MVAANAIMVAGTVKDMSFYYETAHRKYYRCHLVVSRRSGAVDILPFVFSDALLTEPEALIGQNIILNGEIRSMNYTKEKQKVAIYGFVRGISKGDTFFASGVNQVVLTGILCKPPTYRETPTGMQISDLCLAVHRRCNKTDYVPCIAFGANAQIARMFMPGDKLEVSGRFQSRVYEKETISYSVQEVAVNTLNIIAAAKGGSSPAYCN